MKFFRNVLLAASGAHAFFGSSCVNPKRTTPTSDEVLAMTWPEDMEKYQPEPRDLNQSPVKTGRIANTPEMYQNICGAYSNGAEVEYGPISIAPGTVSANGVSTDIYLVSLAGTEGFAFWDNSNNWLANLKIFLQPEESSIMKRNARYAVLNEVPRGANVVFAGHSQGGMIGRQLAADPQIKEHVNVIRSIAIGSPYTSATEPSEGDLVHVETPNDVVPQIDETADWIYDACSWLFPWWCPKLIREDPITHVIDQSFPSWQFVTAHVAEYFRETNVKAMQLDAMAELNGNAVITFDTTKRAFYTAPSNTCAEE